MIESVDDINERQEIPTLSENSKFLTAFQVAAPPPMTPTISTIQRTQRSKIPTFL